MKEVLRVMVEAPIKCEHSCFKEKDWTFISCKMTNEVLKQFVELGFGLSKTGKLFKEGFYIVEINSLIDCFGRMINPYKRELILYF